MGLWLLTQLYHKITKLTSSTKTIIYLLAADFTPDEFQPERTELSLSSLLQEAATQLYLRRGNEEEPKNPRDYYSSLQ